ncbi:DUF3272 family protein [Streptococcus entericus]|uniref:DUF3272 family protein n=1 Tax=Streptococcus entericus TaxID=155680 RepID=UPI0003A4DFFB|nr:DUF3272 family protein [Streptococcus entericus]
MPIRHFVMMALTCAIQTILFTASLSAEQFLLTLFWGILLGRNLVRVYMIDRLSRLLLPPKK